MGGNTDRGAVQLAVTGESSADKGGAPPVPSGSRWRGLQPDILAIALSVAVLVWVGSGAHSYLYGRYNVPARVDPLVRDCVFWPLAAILLLGLLFVCLRALVGRQRLRMRLARVAIIAAWFACLMAVWLFGDLPPECFFSGFGRWVAESEAVNDLIAWKASANVTWGTIKWEDVPPSVRRLRRSAVDVRLLGQQDGTIILDWYIPGGPRWGVIIGDYPIPPGIWETVELRPGVRLFVMDEHLLL